MSAAAVRTGEFQGEFEAQTQRMLRTRFIWFLGTVALIYLLIGVASYGFMGLLASGIIPASIFPGSDKLLEKQIMGMRGGIWGLRLALALTVVDVGVYGWCFWRVLKRSFTRERLLRFTQWFLVYRGAVDMAALAVSRGLGFPWALMLYHSLACAFLPWTPEQAIRPMGPLLVGNAILILSVADMSPKLKAISIAMSLFAAAPGVGLAYFKHSRRMERFKIQMMQTRYGQMRRELVDARRIHEALFPAPIHAGPVRLEYRYEPMRQIGGDYLYARFSPEPDGLAGTGAPRAFNMLLLDVTGHGIAAALTVNRLFGEVERLYAEDPHTGPGEVMCALNRYVHLTLANHSIYATALCARVDPGRDTLEFASGGHPPAFLCTADGRIEQLDSTAFVLGACAANDFKANVETRRFEIGDTLLAYTDGAIECRNQQGRMLGVAGLLKILASCVGVRTSGRAAARAGGGGSAVGAPLGLAATILSAVESHRSGYPEDDTLVVEVSRAAIRGPARSGAAASVDDETGEPAMAR